MVHFLCLAWWTRNMSFAVSIPLIAEFLTFLFRDYQVDPGTVMGNQANSAFRHSGLPDAGQDAALTALFASFSGECPRRPRVLPQWDCSLVLLALTSASLNPLQGSFQVLTWKVFFSLCSLQEPEGANSM